MTTTEAGGADRSIAAVPVAIGEGDERLDRDAFCRTLIGELAQTLEDVVGLAESSGLIAVVGQAIGQQIDESYRRALGVERLERDEVADVLVDLKDRIDGDFAVASVDDDRIVLTNRRCPFGERVRGRESLCMMTSNVFGSITAENLGYAKVHIAEALARGDAGCRVEIWLRPGERARARDGREYFAAPAPVPADDVAAEGHASEGPSFDRSVPSTPRR